MEPVNWLETIVTQVLGPMGLTIGALVVVRELFLMFIKEREASRVSAQEQRDYLTQEANHNRDAFMDMLALLKVELATCHEHRDECSKQITFLSEKCATLQERVEQLEGPLYGILSRVEAGLKRQKTSRGKSMSQLPRLSEVQIERVRQVKPVFEKVENLTGVPWQAVAAVWYRESFSVVAPKTPGGPFQFDPVLRPVTIRNLLKRFTPLPDAEIEQYAQKGVNDFEIGALCAACWLRLKTKPVITPQVSDAVIKDAFYGYNGRAYGNANHSPYVMNGWDEAHCDMVLRGTIPNGQGGRKRVEIVDKRPGALAVYRQLKDVFACPKSS